MPGLRDVLLVLWRYRALGLVCAVGTLGLVGAALLILPRGYRSEAKLFVRVGKETVTLDPTATMGQTISIYEARETEFNSVVDVIGSRGVQERVIKRLGPDVILGLLPINSRTEEAPAGEADKTEGETSVKDQPITERLGRTSLISLENAPAPVKPQVLVPASKGAKSSAPETPLWVSEGPGFMNWLGSFLPESPATATNGTAVRTPTDEKRFEAAVQALQKMVKVSHAKKSGVLTVTCQASSPELASTILQATLDAFESEHIRVNRTQGSYQFFVTQVEVTRQELDRAAHSLREAKDRLGVASIEGQRKFIQDKFALIETARLETELSLAAVKATISQLRGTLATLPQMLVTQETTGFPNDSRDRSQLQLQDLELKERELLSRYTELHPLVLAIREQVAQARRSVMGTGGVAGGPGAGRQRVEALNPTSQQLQLRLADDVAKEAALEARLASSRAQAQELQRQLESLNEHEGQINLLEQQVLRLQASHKQYAEKLEQARVDQALQTERISNVNVVQAPTRSRQPVSPNLKLIAVLGLVVAAGNALLIPLLVGLGPRYYDQCRRALIA